MDLSVALIIAASFAILCTFYIGKRILTIDFSEYNLPIKNELISLIVKKLLKYDEERNSFIGRYKKYSLVLGKDIKYTKNNTEFYGTALDIDKDGGLIVKSGNSTTVLKSGEISLYL